jgi:hypothetical protein
MEMNWEALELADSNGVVPGAVLTVMSRGHDGAVELSGEKGTVLLSPWMSERIWVVS